MFLISLINYLMRPEALVQCMHARSVSCHGLPSYGPCRYAFASWDKTSFNQCALKMGTSTRHVTSVRAKQKITKVEEHGKAIVQVIG
jgi:predicted sugar kinase